MKNKSIDNESHLKDLLEIYISRWYWIAIGVMIAVVMAFIYLRYATYQYDIKASIKLSNQEETESLKKLQAVQDYGLFTQNRTKILDEIEILRSTDLMTQVSEGLNLNLQYFTEGKINAKEEYKNPPINVSFFASDSFKFFNSPASLILFLNSNLPLFLNTSIFSSCLL